MCTSLTRQVYGESAHINMWISFEANIHELEAKPSDIISSSIQLGNKAEIPRRQLVCRVE